MFLGKPDRPRISDLSLKGKIILGVRHKWPLGRVVYQPSRVHGISVQFFGNLAGEQFVQVGVQMHGKWLRKETARRVDARAGFKKRKETTDDKRLVASGCEWLRAASAVDMAMANFQRCRHNSAIEKLQEVNRENRAFCQSTERTRMLGKLSRMSINSGLSKGGSSPMGWSASGAAPIDVLVGGRIGSDTGTAQSAADSASERRGREGGGGACSGNAEATSGGAACDELSDDSAESKFSELTISMSERVIIGKRISDVEDAFIFTR
jgi:hypothetical protein